MRLRQIAKGNERDGIAGDDAGILQPDQREEEPDAGGDAELQIHGDRIDQPGTQRRQREREEEQARQEHASERQLPIAAKLGHHGEGEIGVEPHAGGERDGVVGVKPHDDGARRGGKAGGDEHRAMIHASLLEDRRVDEHDVGHSEEGREPGAELGPDRRSGRREAEEAVERALRRSGVRGRRGCRGFCLVSPPGASAFRFRCCHPFPLVASCSARQIDASSGAVV